MKRSHILTLVILNSVLFSQYSEGMVNASLSKLENDLPKLVKYVTADPEQVVVRGDLAVTLYQLMNILNGNSESGISTIETKLKNLQRNLESLKIPSGPSMEIDSVLYQIEKRLPILLSNSSDFKTLKNRIIQMENTTGESNLQDNHGENSSVALNDLNLQKTIERQTKAIESMRKDLKNYIGEKNIEKVEKQFDDGNLFEISLFILLMVYGNTLSI